MDFLRGCGPALARRAAGGPNFPAKGVGASLDTGAGMDGIDETLARNLKLPITDEMEISGVGGRHRTLVHLAHLYIPSVERLLFQPFAGVKLEEGNQSHTIILGRNFFRGYRTLYDGTIGAVWLAEARSEDVPREMSSVSGGTKGRCEGNRSPLSAFPLCE